MRLLSAAGALLALCAGALGAESNITEPRMTQTILTGDFKPPQVFENTNLVRTINLEKGYVRETTNILITNTDKDPRSEYYVIHLAEPLPSKGTITLSISWHVLGVLTPLPASIKQEEKQYLIYNFSAYVSSVYKTVKQKTKVKFPSSDVPEYSTTRRPRSPTRSLHSLSGGHSGSSSKGAQLGTTVVLSATPQMVSRSRNVGEIATTASLRRATVRSRRSASRATSAPTTGSRPRAATPMASE